MHSHHFQIRLQQDEIGQLRNADRTVQQIVSARVEECFIVTRCVP